MKYNFPDMLSCSSIQNLLIQVGIKDFAPLPPLGKFTEEKTITKKTDVIPHNQYVKFAKRLKDNGIVINLSQLSENATTGLIELNGITSCIYIKSQRPSIFHKDGYTYHLFICPVVKRQIDINKKDRYVATSRDDGLFPVIVSGKNYDTGKHEYFKYIAPLRLCKHCKSILENRGLYKQNFSLYNFLQEYKAEIPYSFQREEVITVQEDYTPTWREIANRCKQNVHYKCTLCGVDCSKNHDCLEVHHKNFVRNDNRLVNLAVLCTDCHSKMPNHEIVKRERGDKIVKVLRLRKEQKIF